MTRGTREGRVEAERGRRGEEGGGGKETEGGKWGGGGERADFESPE